MSFLIFFWFFFGNTNAIWLISEMAIFFHTPLMMIMRVVGSHSGENIISSQEATLLMYIQATTCLNMKSHLSQRARDIQLSLGSVIKKESNG